MAKTSLTKLFIFFTSICLLVSNVTISAIADHKIPRNSSSGTDADPCQKGPWKYVKAEVGRLEGNCNESDMASFANAVTCTSAFLLDHRPYHAASFVYDFHRQNAGKFGFFAKTLLHKLDLNPSFIKKCRRKGDREMVLEYYRRDLDMMLEELDELGLFEEKNFYVEEEDEHDDEDSDDNVGDDDNDLLSDDELDGDIESDFLD